jgi:hypothetical protein
MVRIFIYGSSNTLTADSYVKQISNNHEIINRGLGATTTLIGVIKLQDDISNIKDDDIIIHEYYVTDQNQARVGIIDWKTVLQNLETFIKIASGRKMISILIKTIPDFKNEKYIKDYIDILNKYNVSFVDTSKLVDVNLSVKNIKEQFYKGQSGNGFNHPNRNFYNLISEHFFKNISNINRIKNYDTDNKLHKLVFDKNLEFTNSLINVKYAITNKSNPFHIPIKQPMRLVTIEYLCDRYSGIIQIKTNNTEYYLTTLKNERKFIVERNKTLLTNLTFNKTIIIDKYLIINTIDYPNDLNLISYHPKDYLIPKYNNNIMLNEFAFKIVNIVTEIL